VSTAVGSSRISARAPRYSAFSISTRCRSPTESSLTFPVRVDREAEAGRRLAHLCARRPPPGKRLPERLRSDQDVVENGEVVREREVLVDHADARGERRRRVTRRQRLSERRDRSFVSDVMAEQDRYERRLAGAVLAQERQHLAARELERYGVVGHQRAEALGDARQRKKWGQRRLSEAAGGKSSLTLFSLQRGLGLAVVHLDREFAVEDRLLLVLHLLHEVGGDLLVERAERREFRALCISSSNTSRNPPP
jgi:hypothetical protein